MENKKKPYVKPQIVFEDYRTGKLYGSEEMIQQIKAKREALCAEATYECPFENFPCFGRIG